MKKNYFIICLVISLFIASPALANTVSFTIGSKEYYIDGQKKTMDVAPFIENGRTIIPIRYMAEALDMKAENILWNDSNKTVYFFRKNKIVSLQVGNKVMSIDTKDKIQKIEMEVAPEIVNGRIILPLRYVTEAFDIKVDWDENTKTISFTY